MDIVRCTMPFYSVYGVVYRVKRYGVPRGGSLSAYVGSHAHAKEATVQLA